MTTLPTCPSFAVSLYQETTQGPVGSCITPLMIWFCSTCALTSAFLIWIDFGIVPAAVGVAAGTVPTGPGRRAPVVGTSPAKVETIGGLSAATEVNTINEISKT